MGTSKYDPAFKGRPAWSAGKQVGAKRALKVKQIWLIRFFLGSIDISWHPQLCSSESQEAKEGYCGLVDRVAMRRNCLSLLNMRSTRLGPCMPGSRR